MEEGVPRGGPSEHGIGPQGGRRPCCAGRHLEKVVDMPVVYNDRGLSSCESASDSVHRPILWTFQFATETGTGAAYGGGGGDEGFFFGLGPFFRAPPDIWS